MNYNKLKSDLFAAYYDARRHKRNKLDVIKFETEYEKNLFELAGDIWNRRYKPGESVCFISNYPVKREIFAASFRDRIVHHFIYNYISPIFERRFINDAYSCRVGKGTSYGIKRLDHFIRSCSENYKKDSYVLKLDIKGYFMSINRSILYEKTAGTLRKVLGGGWWRLKADFDLELILGLIRQTIFHEPVKNCRIRGRRSDWIGLPKSKSLFFARSGHGLPIGNLTSQLFGNVYLSDLDHFIKGSLKIKYYGRYVDDMVLVHNDKEYLKSIVKPINEYLIRHLDMKLHEKKIYFQHYSKGVQFLGAVIKPYRIYISNRIKGNFYAKIREWNELLAANGNRLDKEQVKKIIAGVNSYLGLARHYKTAKLRRKMIDRFSVYFFNFVYIKRDIVVRR